MAEKRVLAQNGILNQGSLPSKCWGQVPCSQGSNPLMLPLSATQETFPVTHLVGYSPTESSFLGTSSIAKGMDVMSQSGALYYNRNKEEKGESGELSALGSETRQTGIWWLVEEDETTPLRTIGFKARHPGYPLRSEIVS